MVFLVKTNNRPCTKALLDSASAEKKGVQKQETAWMGRKVGLAIAGGIVFCALAYMCKDYFLNSAGHSITAQEPIARSLSQNPEEMNFGIGARDMEVVKRMLNDFEPEKIDNPYKSYQEAKEDLKACSNGLQTVHVNLYQIIKEGSSGKLQEICGRIAQNANTLLLPCHDAISLARNAKEKYIEKSYSVSYFSRAKELEQQVFFDQVWNAVQVCREVGHVMAREYMEPALCHPIEKILIEASQQQSTNATRSGDLVGEVLSDPKAKSYAEMVHRICKPESEQM